MDADAGPRTPGQDRLRAFPPRRFARGYWAVCIHQYGSAYGGSTTSILVNAPGEASAVVTCLDGYEMAKQGRAKAALATIPSAVFLIVGQYRMPTPSIPQTLGPGFVPIAVLIGLVVLGLLLYAVILIPFGFIISTALLILWEARIFQKGRWIRNLIVGIGFSVLVFYLFVHVLEVMLPEGILSF